MAKKKNATQTTVRPPIVTLMGHVDHGKTSILDAIRQARLPKTNKKRADRPITAGEAGGITQHIGAYTVEKDGEKIVFIDTPGHEAFSQMRARGGSAADIVILVVAADDGVMPQTIEAIGHAKAAGVPVIVAVNKMDLPNANPDKVKRELSRHEILVEGYGGDIVAVEMSATKGTGIDQLLEVINLIARMHTEKLQADWQGNLEALIIESRHDPKQGVEVSAVVRNGTLKLRDEVSTKSENGKIRALVNSNGEKMTEAKPGDAVKILGFSDLPEIGDIIFRTSEMSEVSGDEAKEQVHTVQLQEDQAGSKVLNLIVKADTAGTQEAVVASINKLKVEDARPNILLAGTGDVKESDVLLASSARAIVLAFKVGAPRSIFDLAAANKVIIRKHEIIYKMLEEIEGALEGVLEIEESKIKGRGIVIKVFTLPKSGSKIAGTLVEAGKFKKNDRVGVFKDEKADVPDYITRIRTLHIGPNEADQAQKGDEAGLLFKPEIDGIEEGDRIEAL